VRYRYQNQNSSIDFNDPVLTDSDRLCRALDLTRAFSPSIPMEPGAA